MSVSTPIRRGFTYEVRLHVSIPIAWAVVLKDSAKHHYDYKCKAAGDHGVINGLYNTARDGEFPSSIPVTWSDLDLTTKVAEQLAYHTADHGLIRAIRAWLRETMGEISRQRAACMELPADAGPAREDSVNDSKTTADALDPRDHSGNVTNDARAFTEEDKRVLAWMNRMLGLRVFYVDEDPIPPSACPACGHVVREEHRHVRTRRVREGLVTKVYDCLLIADLKLDDGTSIVARPSHVSVEHGIKGVHCGYFFPVSGAWPEAPEEPRTTRARTA